MDNKPTGNDSGTFGKNRRKLDNVSVYNLPVYHHTGVFHDSAHEPENKPQQSKMLMPVAYAILLILMLYGILLYTGIPQKWTLNTNQPVVAEEQVSQAPPLSMVAPFACLLLCIAFLPLIPATAHWWEHNRNRFLVASLFAAVTLLYYYFGCDFPVEGHWPGHCMAQPTLGGNFDIVKVIFANAIMNEYIPFITLLFSLFVITGGIRISGNFKGTPFVNTVILAVGTILASVIGTTGAAMLLIRLLLEVNRRRKYKVHTVVFFIFTVCNSGGCLTPLGDPPLFLGYLRGVAFEWTLVSLWPAWLFVNAVLISFYFLWNSFLYHNESEKYKHEKRHDKRETPRGTGFLIEGWKMQTPLLLGIIASVLFLAPNKPIPLLGSMLESLGRDSHPPYYLREAVQLALASLSILLGSRVVRQKNSFNFMAIGEVAALFFGIFICMQVPLQIIGVEGKTMVSRAEDKTGLDKVTLFFWTTGSLSLWLDNAPTYIVFFETARTLSPGLTEEEAKESWRDLNKENHFAKTVKTLMEEEARKAWQGAQASETDERLSDAITALTHAMDKEKVTKLWEDIGKDHQEFRELKPVAVGKNGYIDHNLLVAIALGTIFMGGMTYIANGPNFMVKAIAEQSGVRMPSFFGFMLYSCFLLLPVIILTSLIFI